MTTDPDVAQSEESPGSVGYDTGQLPGRREIGVQKVQQKANRRIAVRVKW